MINKNGGNNSPISLHFSLCNLTLPLISSRAVFIPPSFESGLGHVVCFGEWGKSHAKGTLKATSGLGLALMLQGVLLSHTETWTCLLENESSWDRNGLSQLWPHKPTSLQMTCHRLTIVTLATPVETNRRTIQPNSNTDSP